jgi:hypothetical protein
MILPLNGKKDLLGMITLGPKKSEEPFSLTDAKLLGSVAPRRPAWLGEQQAHGGDRQRDRQARMDRPEIDIARGVQQRLFPQAAAADRRDRLRRARAGRRKGSAGTTTTFFRCRPEGSGSRLG